MSEPARLCAYVAFLRGINVGGRSQVKMDDLRKALEAAGFQDVRTVLASGNVLFRAPEKEPASLGADIHGVLRRALGRDFDVIVRPLEDLRRLRARFEGFGDAPPGARLFVTFLPESARRAAASFPAEGDGFRILGADDGMVCSVLYERPGVGAVELMGAIEKAFGKKVTTRSWNTVARLIK